MLISDSNDSLHKIIGKSLKDEQRSTFDKSNPIYNKDVNITGRRKTNSKGNGTTSNNELSAANNLGSGEILPINSDLKNVGDSIEVEVRVGDQ